MQSLTRKLKETTGNKLKLAAVVSAQKNENYVQREVESIKKRLAEILSIRANKEFIFNEVQRTSGVQSRIWHLLKHF